MKVVGHVDGDEDAGGRRVDGHVVGGVVQELGPGVPLHVVRVVVAPAELEVGDRSSEQSHLSFGEREQMETKLIKLNKLKHGTIELEQRREERERATATAVAPMTAERITLYNALCCRIGWRKSLRRRR